MRSPGPTLERKDRYGRIYTIRADAGLQALGLRQVGRRTIFQAGAQGILNCGVGAEASHVSAVKRWSRKRKVQSAIERSPRCVKHGAHMVSHTLPPRISTRQASPHVLKLVPAVWADDGAIATSKARRR